MVNLKETQEYKRNPTVTDGFFEFAEQILSLTPQLRSEFVEITGGRKEGSDLNWKRYRPSLV